MAATGIPTSSLTANPTLEPTITPTTRPTLNPTNFPTTGPTVAPTMAPTDSPTRSPTLQPTTAPTIGPTVAPTLSPTITPNTGLRVVSSPILLGLTGILLLVAIVGMRWRTNKKEKAEEEVKEMREDIHDVKLEGPETLRLSTQFWSYSLNPFSRGTKRFSSFRQAEDRQLNNQLDRLSLSEFVEEGTHLAYVYQKTQREELSL